MLNRKTIVFLVFLVGSGAWSAFSGGQDSKSKKQAEEPRPTIRAQVNMVSLPVVVTTREGRRITDLKQEDFRVFEDGVEQSIAGFRGTDEPVSIALAIDTSGSTEEQLGRMQNAAIEFCTSLHPDDSVAVLSFAEDVRLQGGFSIDPNRNAYAIKKTRPGGCTVIYEAVYLAMEEVLKPVQERKSLVLFSDGVDTCSRKASEKETLEQAKEADTTIYCVYYNTEEDNFYRPRRSTAGGVGGVGGIGYPPMGGPPMGGPGGYGSYGDDYRRGHNYLTRLAEYSGGLVLDALSMQDLGPAFDQIARELSSQYSIGYYSTNTKEDGKFRKVQVKLKKPDLVARTRMGYYAPKAKKS